MNVKNILDFCTFSLGKRSKFLIKNHETYQYYVSYVLFELLLLSNLPIQVTLYDYVGHIVKHEGNSVNNLKSEIFLFPAIFCLNK